MKYVVKVEITIQKLDDDGRRIRESESYIRYENARRLPDAMSQAVRAAGSYRDSLQARDWAVAPF